MQRPQLIIFTDLDGTLLDHHSYSWQAAGPALEELRRRGIPLILTTSKTAAEVSQLHAELRLDTPYIIENGAGIILPQTDLSRENTAHFFGKPYAELIEIVYQLRGRKNYRFKGFNDFTIAEVSAETGLPAASAALARQRLCSEPLRWDDTAAALADFTADLHQHNLQLLRGGRFYHVLDQQADKGTAVNCLLNDYQQRQSEELFSIGLGDGPNDQALLEAVDLAVIIPSQSGLSPDPEGVRILHASSPGPTGWNSSILQILKNFNQEGASHG